MQVFFILLSVWRRAAVKFFVWKTKAHACNHFEPLTSHSRRELLTTAQTLVSITPPTHPTTPARGPHPCAGAHDPSPACTLSQDKTTQATSHPSLSTCHAVPRHGHRPRECIPHVPVCLRAFAHILPHPPRLPPSAGTRLDRRTPDGQPHPCLSRRRLFNDVTCECTPTPTQHQALATIHLA